MSISAKIGCTTLTLNEWVQKAEVDSSRKPDLTRDVAAKFKDAGAREREASAGQRDPVHDISVLCPAGAGTPVQAMIALTLPPSSIQR